MKRNHAFQVILVVLTVFELVGCSSINLSAPQTTPPPLVVPRQITGNSLGLRVYWRVPFVGGMLTAKSDRVVYVAVANNIPHVRVLDATNGHLLWEVEEARGSGLLAVDDERVYFEDSYDVLLAYAMEDGRPLWQRPFAPHRGRSFDPHGDTLYIRQGGSGEDYLFTLDARTGEILNTESLWTADHFLVFARFPQFDLHILTVQDPFTLRAVDPATQQLRWQIEQKPGLFLMNLRWPPVLLNELLLLDVQGEVLALNAQNGEIVWRSHDLAHSPETELVTRAVMVGDSIYALREDARLVRMDARTGQETGYIRFSPSLTNANPYGGGNFPGLASDGRMLFVSFDDSQELIALGP